MSFVGELWQVYVLFSVRPVLSVVALEAEWMLVPSFGFQGGHGPTNDPFSSVPNRSCDPKGSEESGSAVAAARLAERAPHTLVRSDALPRFVFVPYNDHYL